MSIKLIFAIIIHFFSHFILFFISIKLISISTLKLWLDIFNISETKRLFFEEKIIFKYQKNKPVLNIFQA